jgi:hypothetical protein
MRSLPSHGLFALLISVSLFGCLTKVDSQAGARGASCESDKNCRSDFECVGTPKTCQPRGDGGRVADAVSGTSDGSQVSPDGRDAVSDGKPDLGSKPDAMTPDSSLPEGDAPANQPDVPAVQVDASEGQIDAPALPSDALAPDAPAVDAAKPDTLPCNGGCCSSAECPLDKPVCNAANQCTACKADTDCAGRSLTACNATSGACVQCTQSKGCAAPLTCDTSKNQCVGCTSRNDCAGACQTCSGGECVAVKNADDTKCTGTCDGSGQCKAKPGQKCNAVSDCLNNTACADGVCCNRACAGACEACDLPSAVGTCTVLTAGTTPHHGTCANTGTGAANAACAGSCQGKADGTCSYAAATTDCGSASCTSNGQAQAAGKCNGTGLCSLPAPVSCKTGGTCSAGACGCPVSLPKECGNACVDTDNDPKNCGACGHDCLGGQCLAGLCQPVVVVSPTTSSQIDLYALDSQYLYYETHPGPTPARNHERIGISGGNAFTVRRDIGAHGLGVIGSTVYFSAERYDVPKYCQAADCENTISPIPNASDGFVTSLFGNPSPSSYAIARDDATTSKLTITWYNNVNTPVATWPDTVSIANDYDFTAYNGSVYWIRPSTLELLAIEAGKRDPVRMAAQLPADCSLISITSQSLLLFCSSSLYRVPMSTVGSDNAPTLILSAAVVDVVEAIEDEQSLYWANSGGTITKCPSNDLANCRTKQIQIATSLPITGFLQDAKNLYWGTMDRADPGKAQVLRLAK